MSEEFPRPTSPQAEETGGEDNMNSPKKQIDVDPTASKQDKRSDQAKMFWAMWYEAERIYKVNKIRCRDRCLQLIQHPNLPRAIRCHAYQTLAFCPPSIQAEYWIKLAEEMCDEMDRIRKDGYSEYHRERTVAMRNAIEKHKQNAAQTDKPENQKLKDQSTQVKSEKAMDLAIRSSILPTPPPTSSPQVPSDEVDPKEGDSSSV